MGRPQAELVVIQSEREQLQSTALSRSTGEQTGMNRAPLRFAPVPLAEALLRWTERGRWQRDRTPRRLACRGALHYSKESQPTSHP